MRNETEFEEREEMTSACPCCGQMVYLEKIGQDARDVCSCSGAAEWRGRENVYNKMRLAIDRLYGADCSDVEPSWNPIDEETYAFLNECAFKVVYDDNIEAVTLKLADSSTAVIHYGCIERRMNLKRKAME